MQISGYQALSRQSNWQKNYLLRYFYFMLTSAKIWVQQLWFIFNKTSKFSPQHFKSFDHLWLVSRGFINKIYKHIFYNFYLISSIQKIFPWKVAFNTGLTGNSGLDYLVIALASEIFAKENFMLVLFFRNC